uniref:Uncharacterized protein n=1 Tax=viral metagenome TaxID=1070528 RepID=A0A6C0FHC5_9ZZZZ
MRISETTVPLFIIYTYGKPLNNIETTYKIIYYLISSLEADSNHRQMDLQSTALPG